MIFLIFERNFNFKFISLNAFYKQAKFLIFGMMNDPY
jgi:hypothetical protein